MKEVEKIIRFLSIETYEGLYNALGSSFGTMGSLETHRTKLVLVVQRKTESTPNFNIRFNQKTNELLYVAQFEVCLTERNKIRNKPIARIHSPTMTTTTLIKKTRTSSSKT